jgi:uncharacterized protein YjdB
MTHESMRIALRGRRIRYVLLGASMLVPAACTSTEGPFAPEESVPTAIQLSPSSVTFTALADSLRITATVLDQNGAPMTTVPLTWTSSDHHVVLVYRYDGRLLAVGNGVAVVTAAAGGLFATADVTVNQVVDEVRVSASRTTLTFIGDTIRVRGGALDANGHVVDTAQLAWASSDTDVVNVDEAGLVTAIGPGIADVTGSFGTASAAVSMRVEQAAASISLLPQVVVLSGPGDMQLMSALVTDSTGHAVENPSLVWTSDNPFAVTVSDGLVTGVAAGIATVTARSGTASASVPVTVLGGGGG